MSRRKADDMKGSLLKEKADITNTVVAKTYMYAHNSQLHKLRSLVGTKVRIAKFDSAHGGKEHSMVRNTLSTYRSISFHREILDLVFPDRLVFSSIPAGNIRFPIAQFLMALIA